MKRRLVVIDGKSVFYRGYYAMPHLSTRDGIPTGGVYGFTRLALEVVKQLKNEGVRIVSVEQAEYATMLQDFTPVKDTKYAVIFGNEVKGVAQEVVSTSDEVIEIPQYGTKHSLNVSVSAGIVLWELLMKLKKA